MITYQTFIRLSSNRQNQGLFASNPTTIIFYAYELGLPVPVFNTSDYFFVDFVCTNFAGLDLTETFRIYVPAFSPSELRQRISQLQGLYYGKTPEYQDLPNYPDQSDYTDW